MKDSCQLEVLYFTSVKLLVREMERMDNSVSLGDHIH